MRLASRAGVRAATLSAGLACVIVACGDELIHHVEESTSSATGSSASTGPGGAGGAMNTATVGAAGAGTTSHSGVTTGATGGGGAGGAGGGGDACFAGGEAFVMSVLAFDGSSLGCAASPPMAGDIVVEGKVIDSAPGAITVDSCPGGCDAQKTYITFSAPELASDIPQDDLVRVVAHSEYGWGGCIQQLLIVDLPTWAGVENPVGQDGLLRLAAADGTPDVSPEAPFTVSPVTLACSTPGVYPFALRLQRQGDPSGAVLVHQGATVTWAVDAPPPGTEWNARNLRAYRTDNANDDANWGYWVAPVVTSPL